MRAAWRHLRLSAAVPVLALCATAQTNTLPPSGNNGSNNNGSLGNANTYRIPDLIMPGYGNTVSHRQLTARREEAHRRMLDNATRLLALTHELQESVRLHEATTTDAKSLDDIAKLARAVRDQMKQ